MSGEVKNWLPGEPGKYVTILDLKERWMKRKQEEDMKVCEWLDELKIGEEKDRVKVERFGGSRWKSGGRGGRGGRREWSGLKLVDGVDDEVRCGGGVEVRETTAGSSSPIDDRLRGVGDLVRVLKIEKSGYKKKEFEVDDVKVNGDDPVGNYKARFAGRGRYRSGRRFSQNGSFAKDRVSDGTVDVDAGDEKSGGEKIEEVGSVGDENEKASRTNCPCHSKSENQCNGGFWVCKFIEPGAAGEIGESTKGNDVMEGNMVDIVGKKNSGKEELKLLKKHRVPGKVREEMTVEREKKDAMRVSGDFSRIVNHDEVPRKAWQPRENWETKKGVKDEMCEKRRQKEAVVVDKDNQGMIYRDGSCQKNDVKLQSQTVEPSVEIEEHSKASVVTEREANWRGKFRAMGNPAGGRKIYDTGRFKAARDFGSSTMDYVKKDAMHLNSSSKKMINQVGTQHDKDDLTLKLENMEPMDCMEKSESPSGTEMVEKSSDKFGGMRNGIYQRENFVKSRVQTERIFANERIAHSGKFNGRMREMQLEKKRLMWVKKGDASLENAGSKD